VLDVGDDSIRDELTGIYNRAYLLETIGIEVDRAQRAEVPFALLIADIDGFAAFNGALGRQAGDDVLLKVAELAQHVCRASDIVFRCGADEFAAVLPETAKSSASLPARNLVEAVRAADWDEVLDATPGAPPTISVGVAGFPDDGDDSGALVAAAEQALCRAKKAGGNRAE
jgi:diguanylate cyclase (GGDEF)-like protein